MTMWALQHAARWARALVAGVALFASAAASGQLITKEEPEEVRGVDVVPRLGERVPLDLPLTDSTGKTVTLGAYFNQDKPVVLALVYYNCPMICPLVLTRLQERLNAVPYTVGDDFNVVVVSFDPTNTTAMAAEAKATYLLGYNKPRTPSVEAGWTFHTATASDARVLAEAVGFRYRYIEESGQYAHPSVLTVLTSDGRVSRYVSGLEPEPNDLRLALLEASEGKIAQGLGDFFLHRCFIWDPKTGKYTLHAWRLMQMGALLTVAALGTLIAALRMGDRARAAARTTKAMEGSPGVPGAAAMGQTP